MEFDRDGKGAELLDRLRKLDLPAVHLKTLRRELSGNFDVAHAIEFEQVLNLSLSELEKLDPRQGRIVELRFFGGLTVEEISSLLDISPATVKREWVSAKRFLQKKLAVK